MLYFNLLGYVCLCPASQDFENPASVQRVLATVGMACGMIGLETRQSVKGLHLFKDANSFSHFGSLKVPWNLSSGLPLGMCRVPPSSFPPLLMLCGNLFSALEPQ